MAQIIRVNEKLEELPVKNIQHVGEEGARRGVAVLPDGQEIPVYNHPENGTIWYEQMSIEDWRASQVQEQAELAPMQSVDLRAGGEVWIHDNATAQDIKLDALAATRLFDFLLRHMERIVKHAGNEPGSSDDIDRVAGYRRILESGGTLDDQERLDERKYHEHQYDAGD